MPKTRMRLDEARRVYREALDAARANPSPEAWAKLLAAGKDLSAAQDPKSRGQRKSRRTATPTYQELEEAPRTEIQNFSPIEPIGHFE